MTQPTPATLLRLREADVVRFCGLAAAASGLELDTRRAVRQASRDGACLAGVVEDGGSLQVWWEHPPAGGPAAPRWRCDRDAPTGSTPSLCCAHIAALLTSWMRAPSDFTAPAQAPLPSADQPAAEPKRVRQPALLSEPPASVAPTSLHELLQRLAPDDLAALARRVLGDEPHEREARAELERRLSNPASLAALVERLERTPREVFAGLALLGGVATAADLDGWAQRASQAPSVYRAAATTLQRNGLLFPAIGGPAAQPAHGHGWRDVKGWRIPAEVRAAYTPRLPLDELPQGGTSGQPLLAAQGQAPRAAPRVEAGTARALCSALALLARAPAPANPLASAQPHVAAPSHSHAIALPLVGAPADLPQATQAEVARAAALPPALLALARRVMLWGRDAGVSLDLATLPHAEWPVALRLGFQLWRDAETPFELADLALGGVVRAGFDTTSPAFRPAAVAAEIRDGRAFVVRALAMARPGAWYALDAFVDLLWRVNPLFLRVRQQAFSAPAWWLERLAPRRPLRPTLHDEWLAAEGEYVRMVVTGALHWWGILDLAVEPGSRVPRAFRLTDLGAYLLAEHANGSPQTMVAVDWGPPALLTRDGFLSVHPLAAGPALLAALDPWASVVRIAGGRLVYAFVPERVCAAFDEGRTPTALVAALRALASTASARAAEGVERRLDEMRAEYGTARLYSGWALIEGRDEATLAEALAASPAVAARMRRLAPTVALAAPADAATFEAILRRRGLAV